MYNFVANYSTGDDLDVLRKMSWNDGIVACTRHTWVWALYCQMKMRGLPVTLSYTLKSDAINIIHGEVARQQLKAGDLRKYFIIGIRADYRPFPYSQYEIVQNKHSARGRCIFMPLFPQPGLIARDAHRKERINVCFSGRLQNSICTNQLQQDLNSLGCRFVFKGEGQWQDMFDVDILIGIRSFSKEPHHSKPSTKLFNAWLAGIPFIGGYDSAYEQVGIPGENYLRVSSYQELVESIRLLRSDADLYSKMIENGKKAVEAYTPARITDRWIELFEKRFVPEYRRWSESPFLNRYFDSLCGYHHFVIRERILARIILWFRGFRRQ